MVVDRYISQNPDAGPFDLEGVSYFGMDDFLPFNRAELMTAESEIYELMRAIWEPDATGDARVAAAVR
jgi:hypothetical protein